MGKLKKTIAAIFLLISIAYNMNAQNKNLLTAESIVVKTNTTVLVTGETLYYKLFCLNKATVISEISEIAYVEIINNRKESLYKNKISLKSGLGTGDYFIPTTLTSGNYKLIAYTYWMLNNTQNKFFETEITIINPYQEKLNMTIDSNLQENTNTIHETKKTSNIVSLSLDKEKYAKRDKASLVIPKTLESGNYCLSIRKIDSLPYLQNKKSINSDETLQQNIVIYPETRGEIITGSIHSKTANSNLNSKIVTLSIPGKNFIFKTTKTDADGKFVFLIDKKTNNSDCYVQLSEADKESYSISIDKGQSPDISNLIFSNNTAISSKNLKAIKERSLATQIENVYFSEKKDSLTESDDQELFFEPTEKKYNLDDYDRFRTFKETIIEIVTALDFKDYNQVPSLFLSDNKYNVTQSKEPCLVLVDGLQVQDITVLLNYNTYQIQTISVVPMPYYYGPKLFNGIVSIVTKNNDFANLYSDKNILKTTILRPESEKIYYEPKYETVNTSKRIPDYRYQLLWKPDIAFKNTEMTIPFYTSDVTGTFEITLEGFTDQGIPISLKDNFEVQ